MNTDGQRGRRVRRGRRARQLMFTAVAAAALVGGACADSADGPDVAVGGDVGEFAATSDYLAGVAEATDGLAYRMSMDMTMSIAVQGESIETGGTFATGEIDGDRSSTTMDFGEMFGDLADQPGAGVPDAFLDGDLTMQMITDGTTGYVRAPYFAAMAEVSRGAGATAAELGPLAELSELSVQWGRIDLSAVSPSQAAGAAGGQASDPRVFLDMAARGTDVRDLGTDTIDGLEVRGLGATVTYGDMLASQGVDAEEFADQMGSAGDMVGDDEAAEAFEHVMESMLAAEMPVEVWVDGDDRVRRIALVLDMTEILADAAAEAGEDMGDGGMSVDMVMDFTDYGDESIEIEVPTDAVDITDVYLDLIEGGGLGTGTNPSPLPS